MQKLLRQVALIGTLLASAISAAQTTNTPQVVVETGCQDKCGNVSIPYPFGTTKECYHDPDFLITCNDTDYNPPQPFLRKSNIEVTDISVDGKLYINQSIAKACYNESGAPLNRSNHYLSLAQFFISDTENKFIGVGCDTRAVISGFQGKNYQYTGGCLTICNGTEYVENYTCSGIGCCQTPIAKGMTYFDIEVKSYNNQTEVWDFNPCSYAFVVQEGKFNFTSDMLKDLRSVEQLPVVLDWSIGNKSCSNVVENNACQGNSACSDFENGLGYRCKCNDGYEGNPYLGCHGTYIYISLTKP